ncbi:MAG: fibronectin type III domain-containing protein, partial [Spirochaetaceae bacterium]|nr:fibronectin type III domain-containing protein [Spirochaetaceae bacterium]
MNRVVANHTGPTVRSVALVSDPGADATYGRDDEIRVRLTFGEPVAVLTTSGTPALRVRFRPGATDRSAAYASGSGTAALDFTYTVVEADRSGLGHLPDPYGGVALLGDTLELHGGTIRSVRTQADAVLSHAHVGHDVHHQVDGTRTSTVPAKPALTVAPDDGGVALSWTVSSDGGAGGVRWEYHQSDTANAAPAWLPVPDSGRGGAHAARYRVTGLRNAETYHFRVRAVNAVGAGAASDERSAAPTAVTGFTAVAGDQSIFLQWDDPGNAAITAYQVQHRRQGSEGPAAWTDIAGSGARTTSHRLTGLDNGQPYEVRVRVRYGAGVSVPTAIASATPTAGICTRTPAVRDAILALIPDVTDCALVTAQHLSSVSGDLDLTGKDLEALRAGDFAGLRALTGLRLYDNRLESLPAGLFDELDALTTLRLGPNRLRALRPDQFRGLDTLTGLNLESNELESLPDGVFDELSALTWLHLDDNRLQRLPAGALANLGALNQLSLENNALGTLPEAMFAGASLEWLDLRGNPGAPFTLPLTLQQDGDAFRVALAAGAPFAITVDYLVDGGTPSDGTVTVAAGATTSAHVPVAPSGAGAPTVALSNPRTSIDQFSFRVRGIGITTPPALAFARRPAAPTGISARAGDRSITLSWSDPVDVTIGGYEVRTTTGGVTGDWEQIADSGPHTTSHTLTGLANGTAYGVELRARTGAGPGPAGAAVTATPRGGFCSRTPAVRDAIVAMIAGVSECGAVTAAHLAAVTGSLVVSGHGLAALLTGDFDGLGGLTALDVSGNRLAALPAGLFDALGALTTLDLSGNLLNDLPPAAFASLGALRTLRLDDNLFTTLPAGTFFGLAALDALGLTGNPGAPFTLTATLEQSGESFRVRTAAGTPFEILQSYTVAGGTPSSGTIWVPAGADESLDVAVSRSVPATPPTVSLHGTITVPPAFPDLRAAVSGSPLTLGGVPAAPTGLDAGPGDRVILLHWSDPGDPAISGYEV